MRLIRRIEAALLTGVIFSVLCAGAAAKDARDASEKLVRLHVVANSNEESDQELKLKVRDRVCEITESILSGTLTIKEAEQKIQAALPSIEQAAEEIVCASGKKYPVTVTFGTEYFPTKRYEGFALPAGEYEAVRVVIGEGAGENWWCVLFPPLCVGSACAPAELCAEAGISERGVALITEEEGYTLKFKAAELYGEAKAWLCGKNQ